MKVAKKVIECLASLLTLITGLVHDTERLSPWCNQAFRVGSNAGLQKTESSRPPTSSTSKKPLFKNALRAPEGSKGLISLHLWPSRSPEWKTNLGQPQQRLVHG